MILSAPHWAPHSNRLQRGRRQKPRPRPLRTPIRSRPKRQRLPSGQQAAPSSPHGLKRPVPPQDRAPPTSTSCSKSASACYVRAILRQPEFRCDVPRNQEAPKLRVTSDSRSMRNFCAEFTPQRLPIRPRLPAGMHGQGNLGGRVVPPTGSSDRNKAYGARATPVQPFSASCAPTSLVAHRRSYRRRYRGSHPDVLREQTSGILCRLTY